MSRMVLVSAVSLVCSILVISVANRIVRGQAFDAAMLVACLLMAATLSEVKPTLASGGWRTFSTGVLWATLAAVAAAVLANTR